MGTLGFYTNPDFPADSAAAVQAAVQAAQEAQAAADAAVVAAAQAQAGGITWTVVDPATQAIQATAGSGFFLDTSTQTQTILLPTPALGMTVAISDSTGSWGTNPAVVNRNGSIIMGLAEDLNLDVANQTIYLIYSNSTRGWRIA